MRRQSRPRAGLELQPNTEDLASAGSLQSVVTSSWVAMRRQSRPHAGLEHQPSAEDLASASSLQSLVTSSWVAMRRQSSPHAGLEHQPSAEDGILVLSIGLSLGGPTGYAINPARDLGPRIMHALLPIKGKGSSDWSYAWVPIVAPIFGGVAGAQLFNFLHL